MIHRLLNNLIRSSLWMFDKPNMFRELYSTHLSFSLHYASMMINWQVNISPSLQESLIMKNDIFNLSEYLQSAIGSTVCDRIYSLRYDLQSAIGYKVCDRIYSLQLGFPFAKLLRNFCETKRKICLSLRISFARKNNNLRNHSQKSFRAKLSYSAQLLRNSAIS